MSSALAAISTAPSSVALPPMKPEACTNTPPGTPLAALRDQAGGQVGTGVRQAGHHMVTAIAGTQIAGRRAGRRAAAAGAGTSSGLPASQPASLPRT